MSTTHQANKPPEWGKWGNGGEEQPQLKDYVELLIKYTNQQKEILQDTKEWLQQSGKK